MGTFKHLGHLLKTGVRDQTIDFVISLERSLHPVPQPPSEYCITHVCVHLYIQANKSTKLLLFSATSGKKLHKAPLI